MHKVSCASVILLLLLASVSTVQGLRSYGQNVSCGVKPNANPVDLGNALTWVCSSTAVDCSPINPGGANFYPNTLVAHAEWAFNAYWNMYPNIGACDFGGTARLQCPQNEQNGGGIFRERIRGVNIGGWLVLEPYITPSLFDQFVNQSVDKTAIDEYTFCKVLGKQNATAQLTAHWNAWVTEEDIKRISDLGLSHIRVPFGYWIFGDVEPFVRGIEQLDRILDLAGKYGLKVLLDLHGAVGSQNGFDNSGRACDIIDPTKTCIIPCPPAPLWGQDVSGRTVNQTLALIAKVAARYANNSAVWGFELLNEPRLINMSVLQNFYIRGYDVIRSIVGTKWKVVIHDGFYPTAWTDFMTPSQGFTGVILDTHVYEAFGQNVNFTNEIHLQEACGYSLNVDFMECMELPLIVGEWSLASTDCARWLNGFGQPASSSLCPQRPPNAPANATFLTEYATRQMSAFYRGHGWFFWNFKTESAPEWSLFHAVAAGYLPSSFSVVSNATISWCNFSSIN